MRTPNTSDASRTEFWTAYQVGKLGTVSAAAKCLGVHRATVIRHIDALEQALGEKLFHRHSKGYTPTDAGKELIDIAERIDLRLSEFVFRSESYTDELQGELHFSTHEVVNAVILPLLAGFQNRHPTLAIRYSPISGRLRLDYGEAHIALRIGNKEEGPSFVSEHYTTLDFGFYATKTYVQRHGVPLTVDDASKHRFVCYIPGEATQPLHTYIPTRVPQDNIVFRSDSPLALDAALNLHVGIGFVPAHFAVGRDDLVPVWQPWPDWSVPVWFVIHENVYHSRKVQSFLSFAREHSGAFAPYTGVAP